MQLIPVLWCTYSHYRLKLKWIGECLWPWYCFCIWNISGFWTSENFVLWNWRTDHEPITFWVETCMFVTFSIIMCCNSGEHTVTAFRNRACSFQAHNFVFCQNGNCLNRVVDGKRTYRNRWVWKQVLCIVNWTDLRGNGDGLQISKYIAPYNSARKPRGGSKSTQKGPKVSGLTYKSRVKWKMLWGIYSAIYGEVNVSVGKCVEIKGDYVEKRQSCFISVILRSWSGRKLLDPTT